MKQIAPSYLIPFMIDYNVQEYIHIHKPSIFSSDKILFFSDIHENKVLFSSMPFMGDLLKKAELTFILKYKRPLDILSDELYYDENHKGMYYDILTK